MTTIVLLIAMALTTPQETPPQEKPRVPKDSIELILTGCLKGRVLAVSDVRSTDVQRSPDVRARAFRLAGKGDVMKDVKREDHHLVEVTGIVKRSALTQDGVRIGKGISVSGGRPVAGSGSLPSPGDAVPVLDVQSLRLRSTSCGG
jgi:hypothetical protein